MTVSTNPKITGVPTSAWIGTTTSDDAPAGSVGEIITSTVAYAGTSLTTGNGLSLTSLTLTPGDWDVFGNVGFNGNAATNVTWVGAGISSTDNTLPAAAERASASYGTAGVAVFAAGDPHLTLPVTRVSIAVTTIYYLVVYASFSVNTLTAYGRISARRAR